MAGPPYIYARLPIWLQNVAVSAAGLRRQWQRHAGSYRLQLDKVLERQSWSAERLADYQLERLRALVAHAQSTTRWFAEAYRGIDAKRIQSVRELPFLDKDVYRLHGDACRSALFPDGTTIVSRTSGSTGTPLVYHVGLDDFRERMAFLERQYRWAGVSQQDRKVTVTGNLIVPRGQSKPPFWRHNLPGKQLLLSSYHILSEHTCAIAEALSSYRPKFIEGYPSALASLAEILERGGHRPPLVSAILTTAETLHDYQRERLERFFDCKVFNYYGSSEGSPMITECSHGGLHINPDCGTYEFLRPDGSEAGPGEQAELVVTNFGSRAHPLIRYRVRDAVITAGESACACGCTFPRVSAIIGRLDDLVWTRDRGWVGRLSQTIKVFPGSVREAQLVQEDPDTLRVRLVREPALFQDSQLTLFEADIRERIGERIRLIYEYPDVIEKGANNKFKFVVSHLTSEVRATIARGGQP